MRRRTLLLALAVLATGACQSAGDTGAGPTATVTVTRTVTSPAPATTPGAPEGSGGPATEPAPTTGKRRVPDVVGMNHQEAQDHLQALGFHRLAEEDATGRNRMLVWDRNWVVVGQSPGPGSLVSTDTTITLRSKKTDE